MTEIIIPKPEVVELDDGIEMFGEIEEITSKNLGAKHANFAKVTLWGPDFLHHHEKAEETYVCLEGEGEIILDNTIHEFLPGTRVIISPGTLHAVRPKDLKMIFHCISSPAFDPDDVYNDERGRNW
ncbi:MAG: cupin domain-containing protein [Candidatus Andersenbacteria bacterium]|nr:cupin domain-containing protein [Candidatus Andersenbacteria bacterium]